VNVVNVDSFQKLQDTLWAIRSKKIAADIVVIDTLTELAQIVRQDAIIPNMPDGYDMWSNRAKLGGEQSHWGQMTNLLTMAMRLFRNMGILLIINAHQDETEELEGAKKIGPAANPALRTALRGPTDIIARLSIETVEREVDGIKYPAGTRALRLGATGRYLTKVRADWGQKYPATLMNPTVPKLQELFPEARTIVVYGDPGAGKTILACSASMPNVLKEVK
jgi:hypothetical protein